MSDEGRQTETTVAPYSSAKQIQFILSRHDLKLQEKRSNRARERERERERVKKAPPQLRQEAKRDMVKRMKERRRERGRERRRHLAAVTAHLRIDHLIRFQAFNDSNNSIVVDAERIGELSRVEGRSIELLQELGFDLRR